MAGINIRPVGITQGGVFSKAVKKYADKCDPNVFAHQLMKKLFTRVIVDTPVLTGLLKGSWRVSINGVSDEVPSTIDITGESTIHRMTQDLLQMHYSGGAKSVYFENNQPYAYRIEYEGWSKNKAPQGMMRRAFADVRNMSREVAKEMRL